MSEREKILRQYCARVLIKYGFEFSTSDPIIPALYTIHRELSTNKVGNEEVAKNIKSAMEKLNPTIYNFNEKGEAWKFKMAESARWGFLGLSIAAAVFACFVWWRQYNDVQKARGIIAASPGVHRLLTLARKDKDGFVFVEFSKTKGPFVENFIEYDEVKKGSVVRVYLGRAE